MMWYTIIHDILQNRINPISKTAYLIPSFINGNQIICHGGGGDYRQHKANKVDRKSVSKKEEQKFVERLNPSAWVWKVITITERRERGLGLRVRYKAFFSLTVVVN